jgi:putative transposase
VPRIQAELAMIGHRLARATIAKYIGCALPTSPTWRTFIRNHMDCTAAIDFFTVPTLARRVLYGFFILAHDRRRVLHFNVTAHPTAVWVARQLREAFSFDSAPRFLIRDNDSLFGGAVSRCLRSMNVEEVVTSLGSPWQSAYAESFIGTLRRECLDHLIALHEDRLFRMVGDFLVYYHEARLHQGLGRDSPEGRTPETGPGVVIVESMAGGLHRRYRRAA